MAKKAGQLWELALQHLGKLLNEPSTANNTAAIAKTVERVTQQLQALPDIPDGAWKSIVHKQQVSALSSVLSFAPHEEQLAAPCAVLQAPSRGQGCQPVSLSACWHLSFTSNAMNSAKP
jgi:hypothetical protein